MQATTPPNENSFGTLYFGAARFFSRFYLSLAGVPSSAHTQSRSTRVGNFYWVFGKNTAANTIARAADAFPAKHN